MREGGTFADRARPAEFGDEYTHQGRMIAKSTRLKESWYGERHEFPLRLSRDLRDHLFVAADEAKLTANQYASTLLELALTQESDAQSVAEFVDEDSQGRKRVHVSLRLVPSLFRKLEHRVALLEVSRNRFIAWVIAEASRTSASARGVSRSSGKGRG